MCAHRFNRSIVTDADSTSTVLVVEDDDDLRETYWPWLGGDFEVVTASDGEAAPSAVDEMDGDPDIALLNRMMPGLSGRETLEALRERDLDTRYAMVTAVEPDIDIIEMGFDAYLTKPVTETAVREVIDRLQERNNYADALDEYTALLEKKQTLQAHRSDEELAESDEYQQLERRPEQLDEELDETGADDEAFVATLRGIEDER
ncbi:DNA-binding protein [Halobacteriales archaeon QH_7_66_36]|nr:MAG: DNA-binding protein [Halobacteriales archaeon QH_7_66_36]